MTMEKLKRALEPKRPANVIELLQDPRVRHEIARAMPATEVSERLMRLMLTEVRKNPKLMECDPYSMIASMMTLAQLGLEPGGPLGQAWVVPFEDTKRGKIYAQLILGYQGMLELARRSRQIGMIEARAVYEGDQFSCTFGLSPKLEHVPDLDSKNYGDPKKLRYVYAIARMTSGHEIFVVLNRNQIERSRAASRASSGPWSTHYAEMAQKTAIRQLFRYLPRSVELAHAISIDEQAERGERQSWQIPEIESLKEQEPEDEEPERVSQDERQLELGTDES